jgi:hypothetical protein
MDIKEERLKEKDVQRKEQIDSSMEVGMKYEDLFTSCYCPSKSMSLRRCTEQSSAQMTYLIDISSLSHWPPPCW